MRGIKAGVIKAFLFLLLVLPAGGAWAGPLPTMRFYWKPYGAGWRNPDWMRMRSG